MHRKQIIKAIKEFARAEGITMRQTAYKAEFLLNGKPLDYFSKDSSNIFALKTVVKNRPALYLWIILKSLSFGSFLEFIA
jgi:hypothetical protein